MAENHVQPSSASGLSRCPIGDVLTAARPFAARSVFSTYAGPSLPKTTLSAIKVQYVFLTSLSGRGRGQEANDMVTAKNANEKLAHRRLTVLELAWQCRRGRPASLPRDPASCAEPNQQGRSMRGRLGPRIGCPQELPLVTQ
jgi:hypothetical protein